MVARVAACPADSDPGLFTPALDMDHNLFDQQADDLLPVGPTRRGRVPQPGDVLSQSPDLPTLVLGQRLGLLAAEAGELLLQPLVLPQGGLPAPFQLAGDQPILGLHGLTV